MSSKPISVTKSSAGCTRAFLIVFGAIFFLAGCVAFWFILVVPVTQTMGARSWDEVACTITSSRIESHDSDDGTTYSPEISYRYEVKGTGYESDRRSFMEWSSSRSWAQSVVDQYPVGSKSVCYYDPADPSEAVLDRDFSWTSLLGLFTLIFVIVGGAVLWYAIFRYGKTKWSGGEASRSILDSATASVEQYANSNASDEFSQWEGPQKLRPDSTRLTKFLGITVFMLVWNGFITFFIFMAVKDGNGFFGGGFWMYLFFVPFILAGIVMLLASIHQFLCLWNPVVEIALSNGAVPLGCDVEVAWQLQGPVSRIRRLTVEIEGSEQATYTRGTSTYTDTEIFKTVEVVSTESPEEMEYGSQAVYIPHDTMHTFDGGNNEIIWNIKVKGDIPWWPDIDETYPFRIRPMVEK